MDYYHKYQDYLPRLNSKTKEKIQAFFLSLLSEAAPAGFVGKPVNEEDFWLRHIADSLFILQDGLSRITLEKSKLVYDAGSGAGLPGAVLAMVYTDTNFHLIDSSKKRLDFLERICKKLEIYNITLMNMPVEKIKPENQHPDVVLFRAFRRPLASLELILNLLGPDSKVLYWRSKAFMHSGKTEADSVPDEAFERVKELGYKNIEFHSLKSPEALGNRGYYYFEYSGKSSPGYPRKWAKIKKDSLITRTV